MGQGYNIIAKYVLVPHRWDCSCRFIIRKTIGDGLAGSILRFIT